MNNVFVNEALYSQSNRGRPSDTTDADLCREASVEGEVSPFAAQRKRSQYQVMLEKKKVLGKDREILRMVVLGLSDTKIAEMIGISSQTVMNVRRSEAGQQVLSVLQVAADVGSKDLMARITAAAPKAFDVVEAAVNGEAMTDGSLVPLPPKDRVNAAYKLLELAGHSPVKRIDSRMLHGVVTGDILDRIDARAREITPILMEAELVEDASMGT